MHLFLLKNADTLQIKIKNSGNRELIAYYVEIKNTFTKQIYFCIILINNNY